MRRGKQNTLSAHTTVLDRRDSPCSCGCVAMCILRCVASRRQLPLPPAGSFQFFSSPLLCSSLKMLIPLTAAAVLPLSYRARAPRANCYECFGCVCVRVCLCSSGRQRLWRTVFPFLSLLFFILSFCRSRVVELRGEARRASELFC